MNRSRKIKTPLTLCASALVTLLALNAPLYAAEPDEELEVTMDVVDASDHAAAGQELVVREEHEADAADHDNAQDVGDDHNDLDKDGVDNDDADHNEHEDADEAGHDDVDTGDVNDDGHDGKDGSEHGSDQPGVTGHD